MIPASSDFDGVNDPDVNLIKHPIIDKFVGPLATAGCLFFRADFLS
jgi:hypothetical protein